MQKKLGVQLYTVRDFIQTLEEFEQTIKKVAAIGYTAVQISAIGPIAPKDVAKVCQDNQITIAGTHIGWADFCDKTDEVIDKHLTWDCKHAAIGGLFGEDWIGLDAVKRFVDQLVPVAEKLAAAGLDFSYHNHNHEFAKYDGKLWLEALYETAPVEMLKAEIDTFWVQAGGGNPAEWVRRYPNRQPLFHLKDMSMFFDGTKRQQRFAPIGEGNLDWDDILQAAAESNCRWYLIEQDNCYGRDPFECLAGSYNFLASKGLE